VEEANGSKNASFEEMVRCAAPELIEDIDCTPTVSCDTYSFVTLILECVTEDVPFPNITRNAVVLHARTTKGPLPPRPEELHGEK
jgi:hypothetical protein